jgi:hypothetical protein
VWISSQCILYQSADRLVTGNITQQGSKHIRWILIQVAHAAAKKKRSKLRKFFLRIRARKGYNVAIVALARKILCILHHLLVNQEKYQEEDFKKSRPARINWPSLTEGTLSLQIMIEIIAKAGYDVRKIDIDRDWG